MGFSSSCYLATFCEGRVSSLECRMVTKAGVRCTRRIRPGGVLFCRQHETKARFQGVGKWAASAVAAAAISDLTRLAIEKLSELFSRSGTNISEQQEAKNALEKKVFPLGRYPTLPDSYAANFRVDWI